MSKEFLRNQILGLRTGLSAGEVSARSQRILDQFKTKLVHQLDWFQIKAIAIYFPIKGEVETRRFFEYFKKEKKIVCFPKVVDQKLEFYSVNDFSELSSGTFGIMEPRVSENQKSISPQMIFIPGAVFDKSGHRIGYGAGFYDRYLSQNKALSVGLAYDFQLIDEVPYESHDVRLNHILLEKQVLSFK